MIFDYTQPCDVCPRECGAIRTKEKGYCGAGDRMHIAYYGLHHYEEPPISYMNGSGTVFFSGCSLHCVFCQNYMISGKETGNEIDEDGLERIIMELADKGAENINLVTCGHYIKSVIPVLERVRERIDIPIVYNSGGYEKAKTIRELDGLVDIYLPDLKYMSSKVSERFSSAPDYFAVASECITEMVRQTGKYRMKDGKLLSGTMVRHMIIPGCSSDSMDVIEWLTCSFSPDDILISLMSQYTPIPGASKDINRKITTYEYEKVKRILEKSSFDGYTQDRNSSGPEYIPPFEE